MTARRTRIILSLIALGGALLLTALAGPKPEAHEALTEVPVLNRAVYPGEVISRQDLTSRRFPEAALGDAVRTPADVAGKAARSYIPAGVPIWPETLTAGPGEELAPDRAEVAVVLPRAAALDGQIYPGLAVWLAGGKGGEATELLGRAVVVGVSAENGPAQGGGQVSVRLQVDRERVRRILEVVLAGDKLYLYRLGGER